MKNSIILFSFSLFIVQVKAQLCFTSATNYSVGAFPSGITTADFNGDGKPDLAVANSQSKNVSILLGTGTGSFGNPNNFLVDSVPTGICSADFNNDGKKDLAVINQGSLKVSILLGTGTGSFGTATHFPVGAAPIGGLSILSADFNSDGNKDLAIANFNPGIISITFGNGSGGFGAIINYTTGGGTRAIVSADFNSDGKPDLASANYGMGNVSVLVNQGAGSFSNATDYPTSATCSGITSGDFNGDGKPDIATANSSTNNSSILLNNGAGSFFPVTSYSAGFCPGAICNADFDLDGTIDLAVPNCGGLNILKGSGTGTFAIPIIFLPSGGNSDVEKADLNGDGKEDVITINPGMNEVMVYMNCSIVGIENYSTETSILIYPNPNIGSFNLQMNSDIKNGEFLLFNSTGQKVHGQNINRGTNNINTNDLSPGLYNYILTNDNQQIKSGRLLIE